jgi:hypothetical protein
LVAQTDLIPYRKGNLWGFSDRNKKIIISCKYDDAEPFKYNLGVVQKNNLYGCIDKSGNEILPFQYNALDILNNELIILEKNDKKGIFNVISRQEILPCQYNQISIDSKQNIIIQKDGLWGVFDKTGKEIVSCKYTKKLHFDKNIAVGEISGKYELIDNKGIILVPATNEIIRVFNDELYWIKKDNQWELYKMSGKKTQTVLYKDISEYDKNTDFYIVTDIKDKKGVINQKAKLVIPCKYESIKVLNQNLFKVVNNNQYGIIDKKGKEILSCEYNTIEYVEENKIFICSNEKNAVFNEKGEKMKDLSYKYVDDFKNGFAIVWTNYDKKGLINYLGEEILPCKYELIIVNTDRQSFAVKLGNKWAILDNTGKEIIAYKYQDIRKYDNENDLFEVQFKDKLYFKNKEEKAVVLHKYDALNTFYVSYGLATVVLGNKVGMINDKGIEIIAPKYNTIWLRTSKNIIIAEYDKKWGAFDINGKEIIPFKYESLDVVGSLEWLKAKYQNKWGVIDKNNNQLIDFKYDNFFVDDQSLKGAEVSIQDKWGFVDEKGKEVIPCMYQGTRYAKKMFGVKLNGKWGFVSEENKEILPFKYEFIRFFQEDLIGVRYKNKWGFINEMGKEIIPHVYDEIVHDFVNGKALIRKNKEYFYIDKKGVVIEKLQNYERNEGIMGGFTSKSESRISGKLGYVDSKGTEYWED